MCLYQLKNIFFLAMQQSIRDLRSPVQFSSVAQSCPTFCDPMDCRMPGFPIDLQLVEVAQTHVHGVGDASTRDQPMSPAVQVWSPNLWTARDITISTLPPETVDMKWVKNGKYSCVCLGPFVHTLPRQSTCHIVFQWPAYQLPLTYAISLFTLYPQSLEGGVGFRT